MDLGITSYRITPERVVYRDYRRNDIIRVEVLSNLVEFLDPRGRVVGEERFAAGARIKDSWLKKCAGMGVN
jgi:hypothetical protein